MALIRSAVSDSDCLAQALTGQISSQTGFSWAGISAWLAASQALLLLGTVRTGSQLIFS